MSATLESLLPHRFSPCCKIGVTVTDHAQSSMRQILGQLMVARLTASLRNQTGRSRGPIPGDEPLDLSSTDIESLRGSPRHQSSFDDRFDNFESIQLAHAHRDRVGVIGHERLLVDHQEPLRMPNSDQLRHFNFAQIRHF
ncbi:hypothetical protein BGV49_05035 [Burkholderia ubonensis]|nr:hypothetical protein BGV49_05035 [Burkholderia ubonensis]